MATFGFPLRLLVEEGAFVMTDKGRHGQASHGQARLVKDYQMSQKEPMTRLLEF
jgi:hypothetical protein